MNNSEKSKCPNTFLKLHCNTTEDIVTTGNMHCPRKKDQQEQKQLGLFKE